MAATKTFDSKHFNPEAFKYLVERVPNLRRNELIKSGALAHSAEIAATMKSQDGTQFARFVLKGPIEGGKVKYDGKTNIESRGSKTYTWTVQSYGWADGFVEKDFSFDITGGQDFMANVAAQINDYKLTVNTGYLYAILDGIFKMTTSDFAELHTHDITALEGNDQLGAPKNCLGATTLNDATQKACMQDKNKFKLVFMHSVPATNLENLRLIKYMQYTDKDGIQRDLALATWNGRVIIIDDSLPTTTLADDSVGYISYVLGESAFVYEDLGVKVPYEMERNASVNGGEDTLYILERKVLAPKYISFTNDTIVCPEETDFANGANWELVSATEENGDKVYVDHKAIAIARIISKG